LGSDHSFMDPEKQQDDEHQEADGEEQVIAEG
jgi:hypothetical protein